MRKDLKCSYLLAFFLLFVWSTTAISFGQMVVIHTAKPVNLINPRDAVGAGIDRIPIAAIDHDLTPQALKPVLAAGWQPITYRQNTDLMVEAWHWNPVGTWSAPGDQGYFTGSATSKGFIRYSYGYDLPERGVTRNNGTGPYGYSRLTDGNTSTYWKSNPYLSSRYTHEPDSLHPQWVILDLSRLDRVDTLKINWAAPYATHYLVQYWSGDQANTDPIYSPTSGVWVTFPNGIVNDGHGGIATLHLTSIPISIRFLRILMTASSDTCDSHGPSDPRDCVGYAINELYLGTTSKDGRFHDLILHTPDQYQTATYCSSIDPWHTAKSHVNRSQAQVGFDLFYQSGVTRGLPAMIPIAMLYNTPENAAAEIEYLENHKYPISYVEMGEEADGQFISPEDYGALYLQFAAALHRLDPKLKLGGPSFEGVNQDIQFWPNALGQTSWLTRFLDYLRDHHALNELSFFSFEHYPYNPCAITWANLYEEPTLVHNIVADWRNDGLPANIPMFITESNLSSSTGEIYQNIFSGLWLADYIGSFLTDGGNAVYYFHDLPLQMEVGCNQSLGTYGMFTVNSDYVIQQKLAQFFAAKLINHDWLAPDGDNQIYSSTANVLDDTMDRLVTSYAAKHPDGSWSVMLINKDQDDSHTVQIRFEDNGKESLHWVGPVHESIFGKAQYHWDPMHANENAHLPAILSHSSQIYYGTAKADPDGPIVVKTLDQANEVTLPAASIVVLEGHVAAP